MTLSIKWSKQSTRVRLLNPILQHERIKQSIYFWSPLMYTGQKTRCRPSKGRRCIPDVIIEVHVETYMNVYEQNDSSNQCAQHKLKIFAKHDSRNFFPWHHGIITNLVKLIRREQRGRQRGGRAPEVHCFATPIYNPVKCHLLAEFSELFLP